MSRLPTLLPLMALAALLPWGTASVTAQGVAEEVVDLRFVGNSRFPDEVLENSIVTRETSCRSPVLLPFCWAGAEFSRDRHFLSPREFSRDEARIRLFYYQRGYRETVVETEVRRPDSGKVAITFRVQEGDPVRVSELGFQGLEEAPDSSLVRELPMEVGDPLNALVLESTRDSLAARLNEWGYAHADVLLSYSIPREAPLEARVIFDLFPGPLTRIGPLSVVGNVTVSESVVRRMVPLREGNLYSQEQILAGQRNLYNLDIFSFASLVPDLDHVPDSIAPLLVQVAEGDVHRVRAGAGLSEADCVTTEASWASRNFFGGARRLQITGRVSNVLAPIFHQTLCPEAGTGQYGELNWLLSADFVQPWLFSPRNALSVSVFGERQSFPEIFVRQSLGVNLGLTHTLTTSTPVTFSFRPQISRFNAAEVFFCSSYLVCDPEDVRIFRGSNWIAPLGIRFSQDRRNQALSPTRGHALLLDMEHAADWTGSDFRYVRILGEGSWYTQGDSRWVLAARLRGGWVRQGGFPGLAGPGISDEIVPPEKRLYAGGSNSVRGFAQNRLGPQVLYLPSVRDLLEPGENEPAPCASADILDMSCDASALDDEQFNPRPIGGTSLLEGSLEFRTPLAGQAWEGATFLDFGQLWGESGGVDLRDLEVTPGLGIRYLSPIGPIRVDLAYRFEAGKRLQVVTQQIRPFDETRDDSDDIIRTGEETRYVPSEGELTLLSPGVPWGKLDAWSLRRFQLHLSIGQAF